MDASGRPRAVVWTMKNWHSTSRRAPWLLQSVALRPETRPSQGKQRRAGGSQRADINAGAGSGQPSRRRGRKKHCHSGLCAATEISSTRAPKPGAVPVVEHGPLRHGRAGGEGRRVHAAEHGLPRGGRPGSLATNKDYVNRALDLLTAATMPDEDAFDILATHPAAYDDGRRSPSNRRGPIRTRAAS